MNSGAMQEVNCFACSTGMQYKMAMLFFSCCSIVLYEPRTSLAHGFRQMWSIDFSGCPACMGLWADKRTLYTFELVILQNWSLW